jgi:hypothetical protein
MRYANLCMAWSAAEVCYSKQTLLSNGECICDDSLMLSLEAIKDTKYEMGDVIIIVVTMFNTACLCQGKNLLCLKSLISQ